MRIRTVKPEFWRSEDIAALDYFDRLLFIGLWSYVNDQGIGLDRVADICADLFALDLERDFADVYARVRGGLGELSRRGLIVRYEVDGKRYFHVPSWTRHQKIDKPSTGRYPLPTSENAAFDEPSPNPPRGLPEDSAPGTGEQGNRGTEEKDLSLIPPPAQPPVLVTPDGATANDPKPKADPPAFAAFWSAYPRKVGKDDARKAWARRVRTVDPDVITAGARRLADDPNLPEPQFIPHPSTWLARGGWDDEPCPPRDNRPAPTTSAPQQQRTGFDFMYEPAGGAA